jgi:hypothetical protein
MHLLVEDGFMFDGLNREFLDVESEHLDQRVGDDQKMGRVLAEE